MVTIRCKKHKTYTAKKKPRIACMACWFIWQVKSEGNINVYGYPLEVVKEDT